jgi:SAM-dependent methyltransferase
VFNPEEFLQEITQVLKKDGQLLLSVPFAWDEHEQPYDYARYSSFALQFLLEKNGFKIVSHHKCMNDIRAVLQLLNMFLFKKLGGSNKYQRLLVTLIFIAPVNILGSLIALIPAKNDDLYLDNVIRAQKL